MAKRKAYHYTNRVCSEGDEITSEHDHISNLTAKEQVAERAIRSGSIKGEVRAAAVYVWEAEEIARRIFPHSRKLYLYEVEFDETDLLHRGNLNSFSAVESAFETAADVKKGEAAAEPSIDRYWKGDENEPGYPTPRMELLLRKAIVVRKILP